MTIDEAIEIELYRTEANREKADSFHTDEKIYSKEEEAFRNRENYHSQIAEWLKELKEYRKIRRILSQNRIATDRYGEVVLWDDIKRVFKEVNADDE